MNELQGKLGAAGVERNKLCAAQRRCKDLGVYVVIHCAWVADKNPRELIRKLVASDPDMVPARTKVDTLIETARHFELIDGVLFRRVYDHVSGEVQLRCCVPDIPRMECLSTPVEDPRV